MVTASGQSVAGLTGNQGGSELETMQTLDRFLASIEKRAFRMASISTGNTDDALDVVQDSMMKLVSRYGRSDPAQWGGLYHRILQNTLTDWHRRNQRQSRWRQWFGAPRQESENADPMDTLPDTAMPEPGRNLQTDQTIDVLEYAIHQLPLRQQQAFMLRLWEGLSVADTARAMGCTQGSVKTHYSRAVNTLRKKLEGHWP